MPRRILVLLAYVMCALILIGGTVVLVALGKGYSYNLRTRRFSVNGLVIFSSNPSGASVYVDGKDIHRHTPYRATMEASTYDFKVIKDGYRDWTKRISLVPFQVSWAQYIWLFPKQIKSEPVVSGKLVTGMVPSPDHHRFALITGGNDPAVWIYSLSSRATTKVYSPQPASATDPAEVPIGVTWSKDGSHLLIKSTVGSKSVFKLISSSGGNPINLTELFKFDFNDLKFNPTNWRELYWISPEGLRKLDVTAQTVSAVLAEKVVAFTFDDNRIFLVQSTPLGRTLVSVDKSGRDRREIVQSLAVSDSYEMVHSAYNGKQLLGVIPSSSRTLTLYSDVFTNNPAAKVIAQGVDHLEFNADGRFLAFYSDTKIGTFDLEKTAIFRVAQSKKSLGALSWFDNYHLLYLNGNRASVSEYDGGNPTDIDSSYALAPFVTADQESILLGRAAADGTVTVISERTK